jgi:hypothetical protein
MHTFIIDFTKYPALLAIIEDRIRPWDDLGSGLDWSRYQGTWKPYRDLDPAAPFGHLVIETTPEIFLEEMDYLYDVLESVFEEFSEEWGITVAHYDELNRFSSDYLTMFDAVANSIDPLFGSLNMIL